MEEDFPIIPEFEAAVDELSERLLAVSDDLFPTDLLEGLREILLEKARQEELHRAGIGQGSKKARNMEIRRDKINWIEDDTRDPFERRFLDRVRDLYAYLNRTCYLGINDMEFHYACYDPGAFYKRHLDRFRSENGRKISVITYLNPDWKAEDGGELLAYLPTGDLRILPEFGKTVLFRSDLVEHEVLVAKRRRLSVTGWLK